METESASVECAGQKQGFWSVPCFTLSRRPAHSAIVWISTTAQNQKPFLLVITMSEKIYYNRTAAEHFGSAVAAILLTCVVKKCEENNADTIEEVDLQFDLGFSDVEFFSALKTLREKGYMQSRTLRGGARLYVPIPEILDLRSKQ